MSTTVRALSALLVIFVAANASQAQMPLDNRANESISIKTDTGPGTTQALVQPVYDLNGNLVADDTYFYQYDAWNRLVSVRYRGTLTFNSTGDIGSPDPLSQVGAVIIQYTYDGLGRVARTLRPYPGYPGTWRTEHDYYDGMRRVQEILSDPVAAASPFTSKDEKVNLQPTTWCDREYAWGSATGGYVDECVAQFDGWGRTAFVVQDANYDVVALLSTAGDVMEQYGWNPYGELVFKDTFMTFGPNRLGHQGLILDRIDADCLQPQLFVAGPGSPPVVGLYQNRNRTYAPALGRFLQADPVGTGLNVLISALFRHDGSNSIGSAISQMPQLKLAYFDGLNRYLYCRSSPVRGCDPTGLFDLTEVGTSALLSGLISGVLGGVQGELSGDGFFYGAAKGFAAGAIGGAAGCAFAASASGLFTALISKEAASLLLSGAIGGAVGSASQGTIEHFVEGKPWESVMSDAIFGAITGGVTAGLIGAVGVRFDAMRPISGALGRSEGAKDLLYEAGDMFGAITGTPIAIYLQEIWDDYHR